MQVKLRGNPRAARSGAPLAPAGGAHSAAVAAWLRLLFCLTRTAEEAAPRWPYLPMVHLARGGRARPQPPAFTATAGSPAAGIGEPCSVGTRCLRFRERMGLNHGIAHAAGNTRIRVAAPHCASWAGMIARTPRPSEDSHYPGCRFRMNISRFGELGPSKQGSVLPPINAWAGAQTHDYPVPSKASLPAMACIRLPATGETPCFAMRALPVAQSIRVVHRGGRLRYLPAFWTPPAWRHLCATQ